MNPNNLWNPDSFTNMNNITMIIGKSVMIGAKATLIPALILCRRVSEITRVRSGPGAKPADRPNIDPMVKKFTIFSLSALT